MKQERRYREKDNYEDSIYKVIREEIENFNEYIESQNKKIEDTNIEIMKIKTEFIVLKYLVDENYKLIKADSEINKEFNYIPMEKLEETIQCIARDINTSYQHVFIKKRNDERIFDFEAIRMITNKLIISSFKLIRLLHKFRRKDKKDYQPLDTYVKGLENIIESTLSESLKVEVKKELIFFNDIQRVYSQFKKNDELYYLFQYHNKSLVDVGNQRNNLYGFIPIRELNQK